MSNISQKLKHTSIEHHITSMGYSIIKTFIKAFHKIATFGIQHFMCDNPKLSIVSLIAHDLEPNATIICVIIISIVISNYL